jgi:hypothetical protein
MRQNQISMPVFLAFNRLDTGNVGNRCSYVLEPAMKRRGAPPQTVNDPRQIRAIWKKLDAHSWWARLANRKAIEGKCLNSFFKQSLEPRADRKAVNIRRHIRES